MDLSFLASQISSNFLLSIGIILIIATIFALISKLFKQPLIPAYIITGIILGPVVLGVIRDMELIKAISEIGIAFLLFIVGIELDITKLKKMGWLASLGGLIQIILVFLVGYFLGISLGFQNIVAMYLGLILTFSSTMVVIKLLSDQDEIDTLHGRIIIGILLMQDIVAMLILAFLSGINKFGSIYVIMPIIIKGLVLCLFYLISKFLFKEIFKFAARSKELLFLSSASVCFIFVILAYIFDFSIAIGAFIAGLSLASLPYNIDIKGRIEPLKDFFATIFFVSLGMQLIFKGLADLLQPMLLLLLVVLIIKPMIIFLIVYFFGYKSRIAFCSSVSLGQISEFALIISALGLSLGHINEKMFSLIIILAVISITLTSYFMKNLDTLYWYGFRYLSFFDRAPFVKKELEYKGTGKLPGIVLLGMGRMGTVLINELRKIGKDATVVDNNPEIIHRLIKNKVNCLYGDGASREVLNKLVLNKRKLVISTIPNVDLNLFLVGHIKLINPKILFFATAKYKEDASKLYKKGVDFVIVHAILSGERFSMFLSKAIKKSELKKIKKEYIKQLELLHLN